MNSRQKRQVLHAARKLGITIGTKKQESQSHTQGPETPGTPENKHQTTRTFAIHFSRGWQVLSGVALLLGLLTAINSLRYDISIDPYISLDPKQPLETRFVLTNESPFSIHTVRYTCEFPDQRPPGVNPNVNLIGQEVVMFEEKEIAPRGKISMRCQNYMGMNFASILQISVSYRPSFWLWRNSGGASFLLKRDNSGNSVWLPIGRAKTLDELMK